MFAAMAAGLCSLGIWPVIWNFVERKGRNSAHIYMDYAVTYLISATVSALILGDFGASSSVAPNFISQITQPNGKLVAFAVLSGGCMGVGFLNFTRRSVAIATDISVTSIFMNPQSIAEYLQVGDASMQYAVALLGLSVAPAIINALIIIIGELTSRG